MENSINKNVHLVEGAITVILSVTLVSVFLGIFFFTYAKDVERDIVINNVNYLINDLTGDIKDIIPEAGKKEIRQKINSIILPDMSKEDQEVVENNKKLLDQATKVLGAITIIGLAAAYFLSKKYKLDFKSLLVQNLILLVGIALVEFAFINLVAKHYISIEPNQIKKAIIQPLFGLTDSH